MRVASLGSGSRGNATLIRHGNTTLLVDCGFSLRETERRLNRLCVEPEEVDAIFVTHEHTDHIRGVGVFARKYKTPVWMTHGTLRVCNVGELPSVNELITEEAIALKDIEILPFSVPHDAAEPCQFRLTEGDKQLGILTDTGMITRHIIDVLNGIDALLLECNHDVDMLNEGLYPPTLKARVGSDYGHLNNDQAAGLLDIIDTNKLISIAAMHISEKNNTRFLAQQALSSALGWQQIDIRVADQEDGLDWIEIS